MSNWDKPPEWGQNTDELVVKTQATKRYLKNIKTHIAKGKHLLDAAPLPKKDEHYLIITEKQFNAFAVIVSLVKDYIIDEMHLAIYRINEPTVQAIIDLIEAGKIKEGTFVISNFFNQTKKPEQWAILLRDYCKQNKDFKHIYVHNHAKVLIARVKDDHYVFEGSGNMSDNARIEQYRFENNQQSFEFHKKWMQQISH